MRFSFFLISFFFLRLISISPLTVLSFLFPSLFPPPTITTSYCNFMHLRPVSRSLRRELFGRWADDRRPSSSSRGGGDRRRDDRRDDRRDREQRRSSRRSRSRSRSRSRERGRERERGGSGGGGGGGGARETSEERRARIAAWNAELETK